MPHHSFKIGQTAYARGIHTGPPKRGLIRTRRRFKRWTPEAATAATQIGIRPHCEQQATAQCAI